MEANLNVISLIYSHTYVYTLQDINNKRRGDKLPLKEIMLMFICGNVM